jgi:hypothetical protein
MKTILIPPISLFNLVSGQSMHLTLAHLYNNPKYREYYTRESHLGKYIILDNSAHETQVGQPMSALWKIARDIGIDEIVLPDHLFDGEDTVSCTRAALEDLLALEKSSPLPLSTRFMIVPQGSSVGEYQTCLEQLVSSYQEFQGYSSLLQHPPVIGVSKDYEVWPGGLLRVLRQIILPVANTIEADIHLLGWGRQLWDLADIAINYGDRIRSVDSAKPFVYGLAGINLDTYRSLKNSAVPEYPRRPENFFETEFAADQRLSSLRNANVFKSLADSR